MSQAPLAPLHTRLIESWEELRALEGEWRILYEESEGATPFQHPDWALPWAYRFAPTAVWAFAFRSREGKLVGLAPSFRYERGASRVVSFLGGGHADYHNLLAAPGWGRSVAEALFHTLAEYRREWDGCELEQLPRGSPLIDIELPQGLIEKERGEAEGCPIVELPARGEALSDTLPGRQLARLERYQKMAKRLGRLELVREVGESAQPAFSKLVELHSARWRARGEAGMAAERRVVGFHRELVSRMAKSGMLRLYTLSAGARVMASFYGYASKGTVYFYWHGFDPELSKFSPGLLVVGSALLESASEGALAFDFLRGSEDYKFRWGAQLVNTYRRVIAHHA